jgi:hypothetical protein
MVDTVDGYGISDGLRIDNMMDGYQWHAEVGGAVYSKRAYMSDIHDDAWEIEEMVGDVYIYDCLVEGCCSGISDRGGALARLPSSKLVVDGLLMWIKPQKDVVNSSDEFQGCSGDGCQEVAHSSRFSFAIWKGEAVSRPTIVVRNSWFRIDRMSGYGPSSMAWPGAGLSWGRGSTSYTYTNVKVLWTGLDLAGNPTRAPYPGPPLPPGVKLVTGPDALAMWEAAAAAWKTDHGS